MSFLHAWVLVRPGRRDVDEAVFLEPATGRAYRVSGYGSLLLFRLSRVITALTGIVDVGLLCTRSCPFTSWHATYNDKNYWINEDIDQPVADLDLHFNTGWRAVFVDRTADSKQQ